MREVQHHAADSAFLEAEEIAVGVDIVPRLGVNPVEEGFRGV